MSSFVFYRIPFTGKIESVNNLLRDRDWISNITMKVPEEGIILMKIPIDIVEEISFFQNVNFDERTKTKFGIFEPITETDFETAQNKENPKVSNITDSTEEKKNNNENYQKTNESIDDKIIDFNKTENKNETTMSSILSYIPKLEPISLTTSINLNELGRLINSKYKDPYDYFFSKYYLIIFFIFAIICLILFRL